jgi:hypothetical protein
LLLAFPFSSLLVKTSINITGSAIYDTFTYVPSKIYNIGKSATRKLRHYRIQRLPPVVTDANLDYQTLGADESPKHANETNNRIFLTEFNNLRNSFVKEENDYRPATEKDILDFLRQEGVKLYARKLDRMNKYDRIIESRYGRKVNAETVDNIPDIEIGAVSVAPLLYTYREIPKPHIPMARVKPAMYRADDEIPGVILDLFDKSFTMKDGKPEKAEETDINSFLNGKTPLYFSGIKIPYNIINYHKYYAKSGTEYTPVTSEDIENFIYNRGVLYNRTDETPPKYYPVHNPFLSKKSHKKSTGKKLGLTTIRESPTPSPGIKIKPGKGRISRVLNWFTRRRNSVVPAGGKRTVRRYRRRH